MKVGIIGTGTVGKVLGTAFLTEGHHVTLGSRNPQKDDVQKWLYDNPHGFIGTFADAAAYGDIIVLAVAGKGAENAIQLAGKNNFSGKVVIDTTNPISDLPPVHGVLSFFTDLNESLMEKIQQLIPDAKVVKAFNSIGNALMYKPDFNGEVPSMFICGNEDDAKHVVSEILQQFGWQSEDMGKMESARAIEPLNILWSIPGFISNKWNHAFKLVKK